MFDTEKLISEVEKRPPLYNIKLKEYSNRDLKIKLWEEIGVVMYEDWSAISVDERNKKGKELETKWKSLKDQFRKELRALKETKSGQSATKKKKYVYFDQLLFLTPSIEKRNTVSNISDDNNDEENHDEPQEVSQNIPAATSATPQMNPNRKRKRTSDYGDSQIKEITKVLSDSVALQREQTTDDKLGNRAFLLSLLPLMDQFSEDIMLECRMKIMQAIQESRRISNFQTNQLASMSGPRVQDIRSPTSSFYSQSATPQPIGMNSQFFEDSNNFDSQASNHSLLDLY